MTNNEAQRRNWTFYEAIFFAMKKGPRRAIVELAYYSSLGFSIALSIFIGLYLQAFILTDSSIQIHGLQ